MSKNVLVVLSGFTGAGKSFVADMIKKRGDFVVLKSDIIRKELAGIDPLKHVYDDFEKGLYSKEMTEKVYDELFKRAEDYLKKKKNVILDASFLDKEKRDRARELAKKLNVNILILWVEADEKLIKERLEKRKKDVSDGRWEIYLKQKEKYEKPDERDIIFLKNEKKEEVETKIKMILKNLSRV